MSESKVETKKPGKKPGSPKTGGRPKGVLNKKTLWLREELESVGLSWGEEFKKALQDNDYQKADILASLLPYLNPRLKEKEAEEQPVASPAQPISPADILSIVSNDKQ